MSAKRKLARRLARDERIAANQHPNGNKSMAKFQRAVQRREWTARAFVAGMLHALGHRTRSLDAYHRGIAKVGTTISPSTGL